MIDFYDPNTDKIYAKENTISYYHEEGHQFWFKKGIEQIFQMFSWIIILCAVFYIGLSSKDIIIIIICSIPLSLIIISELHAWIFAINKYKKIKNK